MGCAESVRYRYGGHCIYVDMHTSRTVPIWVSVQIYSTLRMAMVRLVYRRQHYNSMATSVATNGRILNCRWCVVAIGYQSLSNYGRPLPLSERMKDGSELCPCMYPVIQIKDMIDKQSGPAGRESEYVQIVY